MIRSYTVASFHHASPGCEILLVKPTSLLYLMYYPNNVIFPFFAAAENLFILKLYQAVSISHSREKQLFMKSLSFT